MKEENKKVEKAELTDEQVEKATGGAYPYHCSKCGFSFSSNSKTLNCPKCNALLSQPSTITRPRR